MKSQQLPDTSEPPPPIRRAHSAPRLGRNIHLYGSADDSALVPSPTDSSSGDEAVWIKPKKRTQFDCNICFDAARDPVVTQCGHLYCWPCLHQVPLPIEIKLPNLSSGYLRLELHQIRHVRFARLVAKYRLSFQSMEGAHRLPQSQGRRCRPLVQPPRKSLEHYDLRTSFSSRTSNRLQRITPSSLLDHKQSDFLLVRSYEIHHSICSSNLRNDTILFCPMALFLQFHKAQQLDLVSLTYSCWHLRYGPPSSK
jgi:hypothetical protein